VQSSAYFEVSTVRFAGISSSKSAMYTFNSIGEMTELAELQLGMELMMRTFEVALPVDFFTC
jgi:hypothetical protein